MHNLKFTESEQGYGVRLSWSAEAVLHCEQTDFQEAIIFTHQRFGRVLMLDRVVQTTLADEHIYHESLVYIPALSHGAIKRVLIIGGGDGGCLRHVLNLRLVEEVVMVEIDSRVIALARDYLAEICGDAFDDPRLTLIIDDGLNYVAQSTANFDLIIIDSTDPSEGPGRALFRRPFYDHCRARLNPGGLMVTQNAVPFMIAGDLAAPLAELAAIFPHWAVYGETVPSFFGGVTIFVLAAATPFTAPQQTDLLRERAATTFITPPRHYSVMRHQGVFELPEAIRSVVEAQAASGS